MTDLSRRDLARLLSSLKNLHTDLLLTRLSERLANAAGDLIPSVGVSFNTFGLKGKLLPLHWHDPPDLFDTEDLRTLGRHILDHPLFTKVLIERNPDVLVTTDFVSLDKFRNTGLYSELYRQRGISTQMSVRLPLSRDKSITCTFHGGSKGFRSNERSLLTMLEPHLTSVIQNAIEVARLEANLLDIEIAANAASHGIIRLNTELKIDFITDCADKLLRKYFPGIQPSVSDLPEGLRRQVITQYQSYLRDPAAATLKSLIFSGQDTQLLVHPTFSSRTLALILVLVERPVLSPATFMRFCLTKREREVFFWIANGKTDPEIGQLCGISTRTVQKHVEHVYQKIGVETRTAASRKAFDILDDRFSDAQEVHDY